MVWWRGHICQYALTTAYRSAWPRVESERTGRNRPCGSIVVSRRMTLLSHGGMDKGVLSPRMMAHGVVERPHMSICLNHHIYVCLARGEERKDRHEQAMRQHSRV